MAYQALQFDHLFGTAGFSDDLLKNHFTLYEGYVKNTNKLLELFVELDPTSPQFAELKRRFGWEFNGMRLHELYFGNMTKESKLITESSALAKKLTDEFGSRENFEREFQNIGMIRGIGWVVLTYDKIGGRLMNTWINEHDTGHLATAEPILIMDVFEHAFMRDYGIKRTDYIGAFMAAIDWNVAEERFERIAG